MEKYALRAGTYWGMAVVGLALAALGAVVLPWVVLRRVPQESTDATRSA